MKKTVFRPFWSYDVIATERWLSRMHSMGYALDKVNFALRLFYFVKAEPARYDYKISYKKRSGGEPSQDLNNYTYETICFSKNHTVIKTAFKSKITLFYSGFLDKNKKLRTFAGIILLIALCLCIAPSVIITGIFIAILTGDFVDKTPAQGSMMPIPSTGNVMFAVTDLWFFFILFAFMWLVYTYFKLGSSNKKLDKLCEKLVFAKNDLINKSEEKSLMKQKIIFKIRKFAWFYSPDKIENWLENMESQGNQLYKINDWGNSFYFIKGQPRNVKFCIDFQNYPKQSYYDLNIKKGWTLAYNSVSHVQFSNVWFKLYTDEIPVFYVNQIDKLKNAKKLAVNYLICFLPLIILYILLILLNIFVRSDFDLMIWFSLATQTLVIVEFGYFAMVAIAYYFRIKKSLSNI